MAWFDVPEHSVGELINRLESDAEAVAKVTGWALGYRVRVFASLLAGACVSLAFQWQVGLTAIGCVPIILGAAFVQKFCVSPRISLSKLYEELMLSSRMAFKPRFVVTIRKP